ncbi:hypothetical protein G7K_6565-t1 [Saitoella complicata NRRL Y-17804]|uniref:Uncharacterized protein n=1 Tax=Saitoella complicata (strain BCRC 22490 / CBS 7301 / JCM 7358 / NBRC 10748 / NRRL Y-17804) TaxID=698492 RepID=A0A0E9NSR7_SAICN|nr:hypothetical protein G7K_6565-t1 [Saitoella complicata NRRL Y-17804]
MAALARTRRGVELSTSDPHSSSYQRRRVMGRQGRVAARPESSASELSHPRPSCLPNSKRRKYKVPSLPFDSKARGKNVIDALLIGYICLKPGPIPMLLEIIRPTFAAFSSRT